MMKTDQEWCPKGSQRPETLGAKSKNAEPRHEIPVPLQDELTDRRHPIAKSDLSSFTSRSHSITLSGMLARTKSRAILPDPRFCVLMVLILMCRVAFSASDPPQCGKFTEGKIETHKERLRAVTKWCLSLVKSDQQLQMDAWKSLNQVRSVWLKSEHWNTKKSAPALKILRSDPHNNSDPRSIFKTECNSAEAPTHEAFINLASKLQLCFKFGFTLLQEKHLSLEYDDVKFEVLLTELERIKMRGWFRRMTGQVFEYQDLNLRELHAKHFQRFLKSLHFHEHDWERSVERERELCEGRLAVLTAIRTYAARSGLPFCPPREESMEELFQNYIWDWLVTLSMTFFDSDDWLIDNTIGEITLKYYGTRFVGSNRDAKNFRVRNGQSLFTEFMRSLAKAKPYLYRTFKHYGDNRFSELGDERAPAPADAKWGPQELPEFQRVSKRKRKAIRALRERRENDKTKYVAV